MGSHSDGAGPPSHSVHFHSNRALARISETPKTQLGVSGRSKEKHVLVFLLPIMKEWVWLHKVAWCQGEWVWIQEGKGVAPPAVIMSTHSVIG